MQFPAIILDTETTGIGKSDQVIELAILGLPELSELAAPVYMTPPAFKHCSRYCPSVPIAAGAAAVHGIVKESLKGCPPPTTCLKEIPPTAFWIGHKIDFDYRMVQQSCATTLPEIKLICTHSLATILLPEAERAEIPNMKLTTLAKYFFPDFHAEIEEESHSAFGDCTLVLMLLHALLQRSSAMSWEELWTQSTRNKKEKKQQAGKAELPTSFPNFGKHAGKPFTEIPIDYLQWAAVNLDAKKNKKLLEGIKVFLTAQCG